MEIRASDEDRFFGAGEDEAADLRILFDGVEVLVQLDQGGSIKNVSGGVRAVEGQDADLVVGKVALDALGFGF